MATFKETSKIDTFKTIEEVQSFRNEINEACDKRAEYISLCCRANELSNKSFGFIKEAFEAISPSLFESAEGKKIINKYTSTVKGNKNLSTLHNLYENIRKTGKDADVDFFVNSIAKHDWGVDKKTVSEDCKTLGRVLAEGYLLLGKDADSLIPSENTELDSAVKYISENKYDSKANLSEYSVAVKVIRENVEKKEKSEGLSESVSLDNLAETLISEFNKKYSDTLSESETKALMEISSSEDRESVFNKYKEACANKISEAKDRFSKDGDSASVERLSTVLEQVSNKSYSLDTLGKDICSLIELSNIFE